MSIVEENVCYTTAIFSEDYKSRYLLRKSWDNTGTMKKAAVIMINPASSDIVTLDLTSMLVQNNLNKLGFGSVDILNICPVINPQSKEIGETVSPDNEKQIVESCQNVDEIIICWGTVGNGNNKVAHKINTILRLIEPFKDKIVTTVDGRNVKNLHPLVPQLRSRLSLAPFDFPNLSEEQTEVPETEKRKKKKQTKKQSQNEATQETPSHESRQDSETELTEANSK